MFAKGGNVRRHRCRLRQICVHKLGVRPACTVYPAPPSLWRRGPRYSLLHAWLAAHPLLYFPWLSLAGGPAVHARLPQPCPE